MTDALRQWVADQTEMTTIWMHPDAPRPDKPYATLQLLNSTRVGRAWIGGPDENGNAPVELDRDVTVSVTVYERTDEPDPRSAFEVAEALRDSLELPSVRETLANNGWSFRGVELLTDTPQLLDTTWEPRATFDVRFGTRKALIDDLGLIETAEITGTVAGATVEQALTQEGQ